MRFRVALALGLVVGGCSGAETSNAAGKNGGSGTGSGDNGGVGGVGGATTGPLQLCPALPQKGVWEDITPTQERGLDGVVYNSQALLLDPFDAGTI